MSRGVVRVPPVYYLYIDGVSATSFTGLSTFYVESDGLWGEGHGVRLWTYSGDETFLGFSVTSGAVTPDAGYSVGDTLTMSGGVNIYLYSVTERGWHCD